MTNSSGQMIIDIGIRTPMRDGIELVGDLYRPAREGSWPVVLLRCPYDRTDPHMGSMVIVDPAWLARQGFAVLVQDTRGRGESPGEFCPAEQEIDDGFDTVEWAATQSWSTGAIGIYGSSYMGISTYQAVASRAPHLRAAVAFVGTPSFTQRGPGGMFEASAYSWYALLTTLMTVQRSGADQATKEELTARIVAGMLNPNATGSFLPLSDIDVISDSRLAPFWSRWLCEPNQVRTEPGRTLSDSPSTGNVALLHITGYRDVLADAVFRLAGALSGNARHRLIAGPWTHRGPYTGHTGARELPQTSSPAGPLGWGPLLAAWFDIHLRNGTGSSFAEGLSWLQGDPIRYYVEGENRWASAPKWPPAGMQQEWFLTSSGNARSARGDGELLPPGDPPRSSHADGVEVDPRHPFPTCGGALLIPEQGADGIQDQRAVHGRDDVLVYTSHELRSAITISGPQHLVLRFSSTAPDADLCVTLVDVEPDGFCYNVAEGFQRARYRRGGTADWLVPGETEEIIVTLHDTAHVFRPGHRLRVMIAGANFPRLSRNLHTKTVPEFGTLAEAVVATHRIHHGPTNPSRLVLNVLER